MIEALYRPTTDERKAAVEFRPQYRQRQVYPCRATRSDPIESCPAEEDSTSAHGYGLGYTRAPADTAVEVDFRAARHSADNRRKRRDGGWCSIKLPTSVILTPRSPRNRVEPLPRRLPPIERP